MESAANVENENGKTPDESSTQDIVRRKLLFAAIAYAALLLAFWEVARFFQLQQLKDHPISTFLSSAILLCPLWFLGFGAADLLRWCLPKKASQSAFSLVLVLPYFVLAIPAHIFYWRIAAALIAVALFTTVALQLSLKTYGIWDFIVLAAGGLIVDLGLLSSNSLWRLHGTALWPPGMGGFPKLMMMDIVLYGYLVVKPIGGTGYDLAPVLSDAKTGLRETLFYAPLVIPIGLMLNFLHFHKTMPHPAMVPAAWIFTFIFVALPEEFFFRGMVQNLLERKLGRRTALILASVLFGLSHFNKRGIFNWRYVLLATIAGVFYGRAWRERRRIFASSITHATVDVIWSLWFR